jgi:hypothetical protein
VVKLVYTLALGASGAIREGSSPLLAHHTKNPFRDFLQLSNIIKIQDTNKARRDSKGGESSERVEERCTADAVPELGVSLY